MILNNKVSIITGGATGIGKATVETFAKEGATVIFCDVNNKQGKINEKNLRKKGYNVYFKKGDPTWKAENLFFKNLINYNILLSVVLYKYLYIKAYLNIAKI